MLLPFKIDENITFKTMKSFNNDHSKFGMFMYNNNDNYKNFINKYTYKYSLLFEYTSPKHKIVIDYSTASLTLISMINRKTFEIISYDSMERKSKKYNIPIVEQLNIKSLQELMEKKKTITGVEGWVIKFTNGKFVKLKTDWYSNIHGITLNNNYDHVHKMIKYILDKTIDDIIPNIKEEKDKIKIKTLQKQIIEYYENLVENIKNDYYIFRDKFNKNKKDYISKYSNDNKLNLKLLMTSVGSGQFTEDKIYDNIHSKIKQYILSETNSLKSATKFIFNNF